MYTYIYICIYMYAYASQLKWLRRWSQLEHGETDTAASKKQGMKSDEAGGDKDGALATFLVRVKEEVMQHTAPYYNTLQRTVSCTRHGAGLSLSTCNTLQHFNLCFSRPPLPLCIWIHLQKGRVQLDSDTNDCVVVCGVDCGRIRHKSSSPRSTSTSPKSVRPSQLNNNISTIVIDAWVRLD